MREISYCQAINEALYQEMERDSRITYHPHSGWFDEGPRRGPVVL